MARYKVLKSVAHNVADSFVSALNYTQDGHVVCCLLTDARATGCNSYFIDFVGAKHSAIFNDSNLARIVPFYSKMFWDNVDAQGSSRSYVSSAKLTMQFNLESRRESKNGYENPYRCQLELLDDRGVDHTQSLEGWWQPEPWLLDAPRWRFKRWLRKLWG